GGYPAKLKKVLIVTAPLWFKAPFQILRILVKEKLRDRVYTVNIPQLYLHIPRESLPLELGGGLQVQQCIWHHAWLLHCQKSMANKVPESSVQAQVTEIEVESPAVSEDEELTSQPRESWQPTTESGAPSSASSGFSDDDSLHCENGGGVTLVEFVKAVRNKGRNGLTAEYMEIKARQPEGTFTHARLRANQAKNRYTDVLCYDHSRVLLSQIDDDPSSDYINANFVDGYKQKNAFISTQGPLPKTCGDFWRMVWEQGTLVVVMTTRVVERGRQKCSQYWPIEEGASVTHGNFNVTTIRVETNPDYVTSALSLVNTKTDESREVHHYQYTSWPDYGVPESAMGMLVFLEKVRGAQAQLLASLGDTWAGHPKGPPVIVHCSAGIGRTGTLCTIDICISRLEETGTVDVKGTVEKIRSQRAFSIQMPDQYVFCHLALIEYAISKEMIPTPDLASFHQAISEDSD
ncbi:hypothetical protein AAG570_006857, partial [Ranatra chinensis]